MIESIAFVGLFLSGVAVGAMWRALYEEFGNLLRYLRAPWTCHLCSYQRTGDIGYCEGGDWWPHEIVYRSDKRNRRMNRS